jgi:hypothetical protein
VSTDETERDLDAAQALSDGESTPEPEPEPDTEPDEDGDEDGDPDEDEPTEAPQPTATDPGFEQIGKKLELLSKHVTKRIGEILGDSAAQLVSCELCSAGGIPGWRWDETPPEAIVQNVLRALGHTAASDYRQDEYSETCVKCGGLGMVASGSRVTSQQTLACIACKGYGWTPVGTERRGGAPIMANGAQPPADDAGPYAPPPGASTEPEPPEVSMLRDRGYFVVAPSG